MHTGSTEMKSGYEETESRKLSNKWEAAWQSLRLPQNDEKRKNEEGKLRKDVNITGIYFGHYKLQVVLEALHTWLYQGSSHGPKDR